MFFRKKSYIAKMVLLLMISFMNGNMIQATEVNSFPMNTNYSDEQLLKTQGVEEIIVDEISEEEMDEIPQYSKKIDEDKSKYDSEECEEIEKVFDYNSKENKNYCSTRGRSSLIKLQNGYNMQKAYDIIREYFHEIHDGSYVDITPRNEKYVLASLDLKQYNLKKEELKAVFITIKNDHPELFWIGSGYIVSSNTQTKIVSKASFYIQNNFKDLNYIKREKSEINKALSEYLKAVEGCSDEYEIEKVFHDKIIRETIYDPNYGFNSDVNINSHNIAGVLIDHVAVCEGYAKTMQMLLNAKNIENVFVTGKSGSDTHAWNQVKISGQYYNLDVTWDDNDIYGDKGISYEFFNVKDSEFLSYHEANNTECSTGNKEYLYDTEECNSDEYTWVNVNKDTILNLEDCNEEKILKYVVQQINKTINRNIDRELVKLKVNMYGEDYYTTKAIFDYIQANEEKILNDENLIENFSEKYESNLKCSSLVNENNNFIVTLTKINSQEPLVVEIPDELNIYFLNNTKYINPIILPRSSDCEIEWRINRSKIATIDKETGLIVPISTGRAIITVKINDAFDACLLTVYDSSHFVYKDDLKNLYDKNKNKSKEDYLPERWSIFEEALMNAEDILDDNNVVQSDVDSAIANLRDAVNNLI